MKVTCCLWFRFWLCEVCVAHKESCKLLRNLWLNGSQGPKQTRKLLIRSLLSPVARHRPTSDITSCSLASCWLLRMHRNSRSSNFRDWNSCQFAFSPFRYAFFSGFMFVFFLRFTAVLPLVVKPSPNDTKFMGGVFKIWCFLTHVNIISLVALPHAQIISNWNEYLTAYPTHRHNSAISTDPDWVILGSLKKFLFCLLSQSKLSYPK